VSEMCKKTYQKEKLMSSIFFGSIMIMAINISIIKEKEAIFCL